VAGPSLLVCSDSRFIMGGFYRDLRGTPHDDLPDEFSYLRPPSLYPAGLPQRRRHMIAAATVAETSGDTFTGLMDHVAQGFEALGAAILVVGVVWSFVLAALAARRFGWSARTYLVLRQAFGGTLLLGLEVLVAADLLRTVAVAPTLTNVYVLGLIVVIRTFLSFSLETEIEGVAPWRRALMGGAGTIRRAAASALEPETPP
jgi:uncharacterized membrane protein